MRLEHFYSTEANNFGRIEDIISDDEEQLVQCSEIGTLSIECCIGFTPQVGDLVELFINADDDGPGWVLKKVGGSNNVTQG